MDTEIRDEKSKADKPLTRADVEGLLHKDGDLLDWAKINRLNLNNINLNNADLHNANLAGVDLSGTNLGRTDLRGTNLSGSNLSEANFIRADLSDAILSRANLRWTTLSGATLKRADLRAADLGWTDLRSADLEGASLTCANLSKANLSGANLSGANLSETDLSEANLSKANLTEADLSGANLSGTNLNGAKLNGTIFYRTNLSRMQTLWVKLQGANLNQSDPIVEQNRASIHEEKSLPQHWIAGNGHEVRPRSSSPTLIPNDPDSGKRGRVHILVDALHPRRWTKSMLVFVGLVFAQESFTLLSAVRVLLTFIIFCLTSSCIYLLNDLHDLEKDREHPVKRKRPIASGTLPISWAIMTMAILFFLCGLLTFLIFIIPIDSPDILRGTGGANVLFTLTIISFLLLTILYNIYFKHIVLLDVFTTAGSAILRILAGAVVIPVSISPWLYLLTILLILFFGLGKRRHELGLLREQAINQRHVLKEYSIPLLDQILTVLIATIITVYSLYTFQGIIGNQLLMTTIPLVIYGMFRYLYVIHMHKESYIPEDVLLRDRHLLATAVLCVVLIIIAVPKHA